MLKAYANINLELTVFQVFHSLPPMVLRFFINIVQAKMVTGAKTDKTNAAFQPRDRTPNKAVHPFFGRFAQFTFIFFYRQQYPGLRTNVKT